ncbi:FecR family protein [Coraliomargarita akajimensis]|uniref:Anti-FecI sigma factor, FecR n=1 Tax=Coraliomargarita akajimensis (strain DSM 45221 / IAM 15411 / JCM 23193 / KCTC 12865 / 04OKA010-24) TaxID=583355 RepID=D5ER05_CORAD|nr:FecR family protein [Coraliomargarita akajimensis]ADE53998.1 anti-FecI sigma factor, FecR [Coraliomargarita akajimensis DSM 45221]
MTQLPKEQQALVDSYFVGELDSDELRQLEVLLNETPAVRQYFASVARDEWLLQNIHHDGLKNADSMDSVVHFPSPISTEPSTGHSEPAHKQRSPRPWLKWAGIAAILTLGIGLGSMFKLVPHMEIAPALSSAPIAHVTETFSLENTLIEVTNGEGSRALTSGDEIFAGDNINVPKGARLSFQYAGEDTAIDVSSQAYLSVQSDAGSKVIDLERGRIHASVDKQPAGKPMRIVTGDAEVVVIGTAFEVTADDFTQVAVTSGTVDFKSRDLEQQLTIDAGYIARSTHEDDWIRRSFENRSYEPKFDTSINQQYHKNFIAVDPDRDYVAFLKFDFDQLNGSILEANLRLRVARRGQDYGGHGTVRLFYVPYYSSEENVVDGPQVEVAKYTGKVGAGMDLVFDVKTEMLRDGINAFIIKLDKNGNDFWFSSSEGDNPPELTLKIENHE